MVEKEVRLNMRKAITVYEDDQSYTFLRPLSGEHDRKLIVIFEDAYGEAVTDIVSINAIDTVFNIPKNILSKVINEFSIASNRS